jgi:DNA-directed RNA polymerase subunit omega
MLHPSYTDLMQVMNREVEEGDDPVVSSRYSIVMAASKRARQLIDGCDPLVRMNKIDAKALSIAVAELNSGDVRILTEEEAKALEEAAAQAQEEEAAAQAQTEEETVQARTEESDQAEKENADEA